jgi:hypothetical protein
MILSHGGDHFSTRFDDQLRLFEGDPVSALRGHNVPASSRACGKTLVEEPLVRRSIGGREHHDRKIAGKL